MATDCATNVLLTHSVYVDFFPVRVSSRSEPQQLIFETGDHEIASERDDVAPIVDNTNKLETTTDKKTVVLTNMHDH